jgi:Icc-related predicted phosphoesterase
MSVEPLRDPRSRPRAPEPLAGDGRPTIRIAAAGDIHCRADRENRILDGLAELDGKADMLLLAGDLTSHGVPEEAEALAETCRRLELPVLCVLGNHDWHCDRAAEITETLERGGIHVLDRSARVIEVGGVEIGIVGAKGFIGGFPGCHLPDFGEPSLRRVYAEASAEVEGLEAGLREIALCPLRIVLLHYAPIGETLVGERPEIWAFLGTDRLAAPLVEHDPDLVVHGHAHAGTFSGRVGEVEVFNVSVPVIGRDYWLFELEPATAADTAIH